MTQPRISIVMNCYNGEKYLREAIESVRGQTFTDWELVFWDNRSTDTSGAIARSYGDRRIRYLLAPSHTPLGGARRRAVDECRGEFVSFLDTDDLYLPENLQRKLEGIEREAAAVVYGGTIFINEAGEERRRRLPRHRSGQIFAQILGQLDVEVPTMMIRRQVLQATGLNFDERIFGSEEYDLLTQLAAEHRFAVLPAYLAKVRHHRRSLTYSLMEKWASDRRLTLSKLKQAHPGIERRHAAAFREAEARADYYEARWLAQKGSRQDALIALRAARAAGWKYRTLYMVLKLSPRLWHYAHGFLPSSRSL